MNSREKVIAAIEHRGRGRIPFSVSVHNSLAVHGEVLLDLLHQYPGNFYDPKILKIPENSKLSEKSKYTDKWGCVWETANILIAGAVSYHPLSDWNAFTSYKMPDVIKVGQKEIDAAEKTREHYPVWAGIDQFFQVMQDILLKGSPEDVKSHIIGMYDKLGTATGGLIGYVPIEPAMPIENIRAMLETVSGYER